MKRGIRALGVAESFRTERSTLCGASVTPDGVVDGFGFATCVVGGTDVTDAIFDLWTDVGREDIQYVFVSGVALAWYNIVNLDRLRAEIPVPVLAVTYEESDGLEDAIQAEFSEPDARERLEQYAALPPRTPINVNGETVFVRTAGSLPDDLGELIRAFTRGGRRPEPVRVARLAARAADRWVRS